MNANDDLAAWGEPPTDAREEAAAAELDGALQGLPADPSLTPLHRSAAVFRGQAGLLAGDARPAAPLPDPFPGEYRLVRVLGEGAFGTVWLAEDLNLRWQVALKTLRPPGGEGIESQVLAGLRAEAQHLAQLRHPNIVQVHAWRQASGRDYLVLQYVPGGSLADRLKRDGPLDWQRASRYVADAAEGLLQVHGRGILHRDIKPANLLWDPETDEALLTDFGLAALATEVGVPAGAPAYMPLEAFDGRATPASDVYSLAASLFQLVTGELPFPGPTIANLQWQILQGLPDPEPRCACMPELLERVLRGGLTAKPEQRPALPEFLAALRGTLNQLLADTLVPAPGPASAAGLRLLLSRLEPGGSYREVATTHAQPAGRTRDLKKVPPRPGLVRLRTGNRVRVEVVSDRPGFVTVFNVGPTGNLNLLYPDEPATPAATQNIRAGSPLHIHDVELQPPAGRERLFAVWSRQPLPLAVAELHGLAVQGTAPGSRPYRATRDMKRVQSVVQQLPPEEGRAVVLELDHGP